MEGDRRRILAMGGGGFTMEPTPALDRHALELSGKPVPKICFLPTASGDPREQATRFYERYRDWSCEPSILSLFHLGRDRLDPREHLLAQDVIYVGGGSMRNMLAIWREHSVDEIMRAAWERGIVLAGLSAGAMCWFEGGITISGGSPAVAAGLGLVSGSLSVHLDGEPERLPVFREAIATGRLPAGFAADDGAALVLHGTDLHECVSSRAPARVFSIAPDGEGGTVQRELPVRPLPGASPGPGASAAGEASSLVDAERDRVEELRALRGRHQRWD
ncbi:MAG TPA: peptidase E [Solirubrobacteraceae bacterium]|nr:peptidase E [Solirubrobacteraceae bacterium]